MIKQALVTGAARGLGRAVVDVLVTQGWAVWATDVDDADFGAGTAAQHHLALDVTDEGSIAAAFAAVEAAGGVDLVVNNAGVFPLVPWHELDAGGFRRVLDVNLVGAFLVAQAGARSMVARGRGGAIVNVTSLTFYKGLATGVAYTASKGGVVGLTRSLARALGPHGIRVNAVGPGLMATEGIRDLVRQGAFPADRLGAVDPDRQLPGTTDPAGVAAVIAFLGSDAAREVTGQILAADGGSIFL